LLSHSLKLSNGYLIVDYQIAVTLLKGPKGNADMQTAKRNGNAPPTRDLKYGYVGGRQVYALWALE